MQLIHTQNQGIINGVKNSASVRFLAKVANMLKPEDITKERKRFTADNLSADNQSGMVIYDSKFADVKPIESKPFTVNAAQMAQINENVFNYFGTTRKSFRTAIPKMNGMLTTKEKSSLSRSSFRWLCRI